MTTLPLLPLIPPFPPTSLPEPLGTRSPGPSGRRGCRGSRAHQPGIGSENGGLGWVAILERRELSAYRSAHSLHFTAKNYVAALSAWDSYLAAHPSGALVHEARYNRAICLLEVGRTAEAAAALKPFASGSVAGGYRKNEARALLEAVDAGP